MNNLFNGIYKNRSVLVTGHTGFKGSWLTYWLNKMGAKVAGFSLNLPTTPCHHSILNHKIDSYMGDIVNPKQLDLAFKQHQPEIVFHLAAQPLVRLSYKNPHMTFETNVMGTLNIFEACRKHKSVTAIINITSDKCYENNEWIWGYKEIDPLGGFDPYSASKGCAEILTQSYRRSFFNLNDFGIKHHILLASCRAGNVIGGGDWAKDRIITDLMTNAANNSYAKIRNPHSIRPWQHVLDPLSGYLLLGQKLLEKDKDFSDNWNFGPSENELISVENIILNMKRHWENINFSIDTSEDQPHESRLLKLDCSKAKELLKWEAIWDYKTSTEKTALWYKNYYLKNEILTEADLEGYLADAKNKKMTWVD